MLGAVAGGSEDKSLFLEGGLQFAENISFGSHLRRVILGQITVIHLETVVVLRHRNDISGAR